MAFRLRLMRMLENNQAGKATKAISRKQSIPVTARHRAICEV
jgi:hypothetical protein